MEDHRSKIEGYSLTMETMGLTPVAARVFVYLLLCRQEQATFEAIVNYFTVSKSAVSNAIKMLTVAGMVESKTVGGQRKRYFKVSFERMLDQQQMASRFQAYYTMLDDIRQSRDSHDQFSQELANVSAFYKMMMIEFPIILERWKRMVELTNRSS